MGFTEPPQSPGVLVVSYTTVSPLLPMSKERFVFCGTVPRVTPGGRYPPPRSVESGLSSAPPLRRRGGTAIAWPTRPPSMVVPSRFQRAASGGCCRSPGRGVTSKLSRLEGSGTASVRISAPVLHGQGVLELGAAAAVRGHHGPVVIPHVRSDCCRSVIIGSIVKVMPTSITVSYAGSS